MRASEATADQMTAGQQVGSVDVEVDVGQLNVVAVTCRGLDDVTVMLAVQLQLVRLDATKQRQQLAGYSLIHSTQFHLHTTSTTDKLSRRSELGLQQQQSQSTWCVRKLHIFNSPHRCNSSRKMKRISSECSDHVLVCVVDDL